MASAVLDESGSVKHGAVATGDELGRQVRAVMHRKQVPSVDLEELPRGRDQGEGGGIESIIVARSAIGNVPRGSGVVGDLLRRTVVDSSLSVVEVHVAGEDKVDAELEEEWLKGTLAHGTSRGADIPPVFLRYRS